MHPTFSRRDLLAGSVAALAGLRTGFAQSGKNVPFKLGVASYSLRKLSRADAIKALETLNVKYVNIKEFHAPIKGTPEEWKQARRDFESAGITILGVGNISMTKSDEGEIRRNFDYAKTLGAPLIVMAPSHQTVPMIEKFVKEYNIKAAIHNHGPEDKHFPAPQDVLDAVKGMDKRMGLCIDVGHTTRTGTNVVESIRIAGGEGRLHDLHMKDLADLMVSKSQVAVGEGKMPVRDIFAELIRQKFNGGVMLEYEINADNPVPGMQKSFEHMRRVLAEMKS
jgi:sugar phosphate isomerase/epimerase